MPNHTTIILTVTGNQTQREQFTKDINGENGALDFEKLYPIPPGQDWYKWSIQHWGTKWNAYEIKEWEYYSDFQTIHYQTAWNPPAAFFVYVSKLYPLLTFLNEYADEGGRFIGYHTIQNGQIDFVDYPWYSDEGIRMQKYLGVFFESEEED